MKKKDNIISKIKKIKNNKLLDSIKNYNIDFLRKNNKKLLELYNDNNKLLTGEYNFYGIYQHSSKLWVWASSIPGVDIRHLKNVNKLRELNHLFESKNDEISNFYYQLLTKDIIYINNNKKLDLINKLLLYLSNDKMFINPINSHNNIQFITISKILEKYY